MHKNEEILADCIACATIYAELSSEFARLEAIRQSRPESRSQPYRVAGAKVARDNAHRRLLRNLNALREAGDRDLADVILRNAHCNASLAETLATRKALAMLREVA